MGTNSVGTSERLQAAALRLFAVRGFEATGIRQIADEARISVSSLYHHVGTKEDLLALMMRESMYHLLDPAQVVMRNCTDPVDQVAGLVDVHVRKHAQQNRLCIVGDTEIRALSPARRREIVGLRDMYQSMWETAIGSGVDQGVFRVPEVKMAAFAVIEMCTGVAYWYPPRGRLSLGEISKSFVAMTLSLLAGGEPPLAGDGRCGNHFSANAAPALGDCIAGTSKHASTDA